ncbi:MAG: class I SAM-dependent methyltransferase [Fimbriiglobus sp.]
MMSLLSKLRDRVRPPRPSAAPPASTVDATADPTFAERKRQKLERIRPLLIDGIGEPGPLFFDCLTPDLRAQFDIVDTENVSSHEYDKDALRVLNEIVGVGGIVLDCGAGLRRTYRDDVVNFEICPYPTTDVRGVNEKLPFRDETFDGVFSFNVLEHVRDPFAAALEIARVMKPGGKLYCVVPFLQPFHAYPHHYYNMTAQGLKALFENLLRVDKQEVNVGGQPIFMLTWVLARWADGLPAAAREEFLKLRVEDLIGDPLALLDKPFVKQLIEERQFELAATTSLFARKPMRM